MHKKLHIHFTCKDQSLTLLCFFWQPPYRMPTAMGMYHTAAQPTETYLSLADQGISIDNMQAPMRSSLQSQGISVDNMQAPMRSSLQSDGGAVQVFAALVFHPHAHTNAHASLISFFSTSIPSNALGPDLCISGSIFGTQRAMQTQPSIPMRSSMPSLPGRDALPGRDLQSSMDAQTWNDLRSSLDLRPSIDLRASGQVCLLPTPQCYRIRSRPTRKKMQGCESSQCCMSNGCLFPNSTSVHTGLCILPLSGLCILCIHIYRFACVVFYLQ